MKPLTLLGVALVVLGVLALAFRGTTYTTREKVIDLGPLTASVEKKTFSLSPIVGVVVLAGGTVLIYVGTRKS
jgi:hypothetical protein